MPRRVKWNVMKSLPTLLFWEKLEPVRPALSTGACALNVHPQHIDQLGLVPEQMVALGTGEAEIGATLGQANAADQLAIRIPHRDAGIAQRRGRAAPDIAGVTVW